MAALPDYILDLIRKLGRSDEAEGAALDSEYPGPVGGPADRVRHRQWNSALTREGIGGEYVPDALKAPPALAATAAFETLETAGAALRHSTRGDWGGVKEALREAGSDLRSNLSGAWNQIAAKDAEDAKRRNLRGAIQQAIDEGTISRREGRELLAKHGLALNSEGY